MEQPGANCRALNRGSRREPIFRSDEDRQRKGGRRKVKMARRLRQETTMRLKWMAEALKMGHRLTWPTRFTT